MNSPQNGGGIEITNLREFRADLRRAQDASPRELTKALKTAGAPILKRTQSLAPVGTRKDDKHKGALRKGYALSVSGSTASLVSKTPWGGGAEWGMHGKWKGFLKYPPASGESRGRFGWRAITELADQTLERVYEGLRDIVTIHGWAR
jgi:hypothetical protein